MKIFSWSNPSYFHFLVGMVGSIRYHGNRHEIILHLMDFSEKEKVNAIKTFEHDSKVSFIYSSSDDNSYKVSNIADKREYYRNCRPRYFLDILEETKEDLLTFGSNGIIRCDLKFIENFLAENDFCFLERSKKMRGVVYHTVREYHNAVLAGSILSSPKSYGNMVLLGTHAIAYNERTLEVVRMWRDSIENTKAINEYKWDMGLFARSMSIVEDKYGESFKIKTGAKVERNKHPFCDTSFSENSNIWFAKSKAKWKNKHYLKQVKFYTDYKYEL